MKTFINLLPPDYRARELRRCRLMQWSGVWAVCLGAAVAGWWFKQAHCDRAQQALEAAEQSYRPLAKLSRELATMQAELDSLHSKGTILGQLRDERPLLTLIGVTSQSARQSGGRLVVHSLSFRRHEPPSATGGQPRETSRKGPEPPAETEPGPWATVSLSGDALDNLAVARFVVGLRDTGLFRRVELISSVGDPSAKSNLRSFSLECDI